jgi:hypothetical protein
VQEQKRKTDQKELEQDPLDKLRRYVEDSSDEEFRVWPHDEFIRMWKALRGDEFKSLAIKYSDRRSQQAVKESYFAAHGFDADLAEHVDDLLVHLLDHVSPSKNGIRPADPRLVRERFSVLLDEELERRYYGVEPRPVLCNAQKPTEHELVQIFEHWLRCWLEYQWQIFCKSQVGDVIGCIARLIEILPAEYKTVIPDVLAEFGVNAPSKRSDRN